MRHCFISSFISTLCFTYTFAHHCLDDLTLRVTVHRPCIWPYPQVGPRTHLPLSGCRDYWENGPALSGSILVYNTGRSMGQVGPGLS